MSDISIGAVGASIIAGLVSMLGLIIGKEQKISEFRQAWIDDLRQCLITYLVHINAITDAVRISRSTGAPLGDISDHYANLNRAHHGILLRINDIENPSSDLKAAMARFEEIASSNETLTTDNIKEAEDSFLKASKELLKYEWTRVKRGEKTYYYTKHIIMILVICMILLFTYLWYNRDNEATSSVQMGKAAASNNLICQLNAPPTSHREVSIARGSAKHGTDQSSSGRKSSTREACRIPPSVTTDAQQVDVNGPSTPQMAR